MKLKVYLEIILHILLLGVVFPLLISSNRLELFYPGLVAVLVYVYVNVNRVIKYVNKEFE